ncbi:hypothetical protein [uncultured Tenacibaculum sp.]|uniref:hypothetical protein n=1 Tax=uncultured Tenacibaculum sp. TaxID=174713 RepID=UPI00260F7D57|nr:hypothetical protein [uncultured Tenacibaculum sp.]
MELLIFRTNIESEKKVKSLELIFNNHQSIINWSIDIEDIDNVLRIEASGNLLEKDIIYLVRTKGFYIEVLPDETVIKTDTVLIY